MHTNMMMLLVESFLLVMILGLNERPNGELPPNTQVNPKDGDARKIHINALNIPKKEVSGSTSTRSSDDLNVVQVKPKMAPLREYQPKLRKELNAAKEYNTKLEEKKAKALKKDDQEHRVKVNMAKEKNGGQIWMRREESPREKEEEISWDQPQHEKDKKEVPMPNEKKKKSRSKKPIQQKEDVMPVKQGDPGSFLIPCSFETGITYNALADLGAAIRCAQRLESNY